MNGHYCSRALRNGLLFVSLLLPVACRGASSGKIESVAISPDGKIVAVGFRKGDTSFIYRIDVGAVSATRLTNAKTGEESSPAFSPDGKKIAYCYSPTRGTNATIVVVNTDGSEPHSWSPTGSGDFSPSFSPDNETIIFARSGYYGSSSPIAQPHHHAWNFYASSVDGANVRQLTNEKFYMASEASVSPDSKNIVAVTEDLDTSPQLAIYSLDHSDKATLSLRPHLPGEPKIGQEFDSPNYMPDGKSILFLAATNGRHGYDYDAYRVDIGSGAVERLTKGNGFASNLRISADGKTAVFLKWRSDWHGTPAKSEVYLLDVQSRKLTPLKISGLD
jgi:Tol biopolymer transport system component